MSDRVTVEIENHVAEVTLNRPEKHNAVDLAMFEALIDAGDVLAKNTDVRAVILRGSGDNFCAGIDLSVFQGGGLDGLDKNAFKPRDGSPANFFQSAEYASSLTLSTGTTSRSVAVIAMSGMMPHLISMMESLASAVA